MKEEAVFWLGTKPGAKKAVETPDAAALEPAVFGACRAQGIEPEDFVAALGGYGSWLTHFSRGSTRERIVWNGRDGKLVLQSAIRSGGWRDERDCTVTQADAAGVAAAIATLLGPSAS